MVGVLPHKGIQEMRRSWVLFLRSFWQQRGWFPSQFCVKLEVVRVRKTIESALKSREVTEQNKFS